MTVFCSFAKNITYVYNSHIIHIFFRRSRDFIKIYSFYIYFIFTGRSQNVHNYVFLIKGASTYSGSPKNSAYA